MRRVPATMESSSWSSRWSWIRLAVLGACALASVATSAPRYTYPRNYPAWQVESGATVVSNCAELRVWISKSGKEGVGVTVEATPIGGARGCNVGIDGRLVIDGTSIESEETSPEILLLDAGERGHIYVPFVFDNESMWNDGRVRGTLELSVYEAIHGVFADSRRVHTLPIRHVWGEPHRKIDRYQVKPGLVRP